MKRVIGLIACFSIAVFAQGYQQPQPAYYPPQQQQPVYQAPAQQPAQPYYAPAPVQQAPAQPYYAPAPAQQAPVQPYYAPAPAQPVPAQPYYAQPVQPYPPQAQQPMPPQPQDEKKTQFGITALVGMNSYSEDGDDDDDIEAGVGFGGGIALSIPITDMISFVPEVDFLYRTIAKISQTEEDCDYYDCYTYGADVSWNELALSFPLMIQIKPSPSVPFYIAAGLQIDIPFGSEIKVEYSVDGEVYDEYTETEEVDKRSTDYSLALGAGFRMGNLGIEARTVFGMTPLTDNSGDKSSLNQYSLIVSAFF